MGFPAANIFVNFWKIFSLGEVGSKWQEAALFPAAGKFGNSWKGAGNNWKTKTQLPAAVKFGKKWEASFKCKNWKKLEKPGQ